jgi:hypothetical protein
MKRPLPKVPKWLQLALVLTALLLLALSYWQFKGCPRFTAAGELRRMERAHQYEQTRLTALLPQRDGGHLAIGLSDDRLHVTLLEKKGLWWLGEVSSHSGLISLKTGEEPTLTMLPWPMPDGGEEPKYYWAALVYAPGTQAANGALTLTVDNDGEERWSFPGRLCWQQDDLYLFLLDIDVEPVLSFALQFELNHYLLGDPDPPRYGIWMEGALYDQSGAPLTTLYKAYPVRK